MDANSVLNTTLVYAQLRDDILRGRLTAGQRLVTQRIAAQANVSRTPVKEALARLEAEGLVLREDNWGYSVRTIALRDAEEIFEGRLIIEVAAARLAAERASAEDKKDIAEALGKSAASLREDRLVDFQVDSRSVHRKIVAASANSQVERMFRQLDDLVLIFGLSLLRAQPQRAQEIYSENAAIAQAISRGNADKAAELMRQHIECGHTRFRESIGSRRIELRLP